MPTKEMELTRKADWTLKGVKTFRGEECEGYNADLYLRGKKVAQADEAAQGGPLQWYWMDRQAEALFDSFAKSLPNLESQYFPDGLEMDMDLLLGEMVSDFLQERDWKRICRKKTAILLKSHGDGEYATYKQPYSPAFAKKVREWNGNDLVEIINERYL
jgi:hypothetical protein|tara:strand:+ start:4359 stop:4835 length:477 start_codon:yes stop_codon:yes gene_type:complete